MSTFPTFSEFYRAIHGHEPFPWQTALAHRVADGSWPDLIDVPTGLGKTSVIDVAVFELARQAGNADRTARTRTALIVDRRLVVDGAFTHASKIADALDGAADGSELAVVAARLKSLVAPSPLGNRPLEVVRMRGGVTWAARWLRGPEQPAVILGTVDQFGSRLLFRGYGTSDRMKPIDAALVGCDLLCLLDEAHLSTALADSIEECQFHEDRAEGRVGRPLAVVKMSATSRAGGGDVHGVSDADRDSVAADRLTAAKYTTLIELGPKLVKKPAASFAAAAQMLLARNPSAAIGVVVNTVGLARQVYADLEKLKVPCALAIGRCRPIDRELSENLWWSRTRVGRDRVTASGFVLVATQTVEVGVDLDLDGAVIQCASIDAVVQRFGRVDRLGAVGETRSLIVRTGNTDPVYGEAAERTWSALAGASEPTMVDDLASIAALDLGKIDAMDLGPLALREWMARVARPELLMAPVNPSPLPTAATISWWRRTAPIPEPDEDLAAYLHGAGTWSPTVSVAWRTGLGDCRTAEGANAANELLAVLPPTADELVEVSIGSLRGLLNGSAVDSVDLDGVDVDVDGASRRAAVAPVDGLVWRRERWDPVDAAGIRPGDIVVVPAEIGGHDNWGWTGVRESSVVDVGGLGLSRSGTFRLRLVPEVLVPLIRADGAAAVVEALNLETELSADAAARVTAMVRARSEAVAAEDLAHYSSILVRRLEALGTRVVLVPVVRPAASDDGAPEVIRIDLVGAGRTSRFALINDDSESSTSAEMGAEVTLADHLRSVGERAGEHAQRLGLAPDVIAACRLAGRFHDLGKAEVRFQTLLRHGRRHVAEALCDDAESALAKSSRINGAGAREISKRSGWPLGMRHEAVSLMLAQSAPAKAFAGVDRRLVEHLVASHHGHARPFYPPVLDGAPTRVEVSFDGTSFVADSARAHPALDHAADFERLNLAYGTWGLALLEAVVRLADMAISEEGS